MEVNTTTTSDPINMFNGGMIHPGAIAVILGIIIIYILISASLGDTSSTSDSASAVSDSISASAGMNVMGIIIAVILVALIAVNALQYFFSISVTALIRDFFTPNPVIDIVVDQTNAPVPEILYKKQVFNVPENKYNYENAKALCTAYGSRLATYKEVEDSYNNGGEWCNYGWSEGQMALFPTQQTTFDNLQNIKGHEHDCGRPGVNGGYMANPRMKFGVNCYGYKPKMNSTEEEMMQNVSPYPQSMEDIVFQKRVDYWKNQIEQILVSPFNYKNWSS
jgi:hypothetical protein